MSPPHHGEPLSAQGNSNVGISQAPDLTPGFTPSTENQTLMKPINSSAAFSIESRSLSRPAASNVTPYSPPFKCEWKDCREKKIFLRKSEFRKHMDRHERPYTCLNAGCNGANFSDKAGLQRHEKEQHGNSNLLCPVVSCPRHRRGFARKRNLETHIVARHEKNGRSNSAIPSMNSAPSESSESEDNEELNNSLDSASPLGEISNLKIELQELEARKKALVEQQVKVDADIHAVRRSMHLLSARQM